MSKTDETEQTAQPTRRFLQWLDFNASRNWYAAIYYDEARGELMRLNRILWADIKHALPDPIPGIFNEPKQRRLDVELTERQYAILYKAAE